jgi:energy-coupling factor transport system permease protein
MISGSYVEKSSFLHSADARIKLFFLVFLTIIFFLPLPLEKYTAAIAALLITGTLSINLKQTLKPLKAILPLVIMILLLTPPFHTTGTPYIVLWGYPIVTSGGLYQAAYLIDRFIGITLIFAIFLMTTKAEDFTLSLRFFRLPYRLALMISLTVRYFPYAVSIYEGTIDAHKMRLTPASATISKWNFPAKFRRLLSALISVLIQAIKTIPNLAMALETRGVGRKNKPGNMRRLKKLKELIKQLLFTFIVVLGIINYLLFF